MIISSEECRDAVLWWIAFSLRGRWAQLSANPHYGNFYIYDSLVYQANLSFLHSLHLEHEVPEYVLLNSVWRVSVRSYLRRLNPTDKELYVAFKQNNVPLV